MAGQLRVEPLAEQRLRAVDVAHSGDHGLIHEQRRQRRPGAGDPGPGAVRVGVVAQRVRPEARVDDVDLGVGEQLAGGGAAQVRVVRLADHPHPHLAPGLRGRQPVVGEPPVQAQMHMHDDVGSVVVEQVLAVRLRRLEHPPVDQLRARRETALRAGHRDRSPDVAAGVQGGEPMEGMTFGHQPLLPGSGGGVPVRS